jgi:hypothetical protein
MRARVHIPGKHGTDAAKSSNPGAFPNCMASLKPRRTALVAALLCALVQANGTSAAATCPARGSAGPLYCFSGTVYSAAPDVGGSCMCRCDDNRGIGFTIAPTESYCQRYGSCATIFPSMCPNSSITGGWYISVSEFFNFVQGPNMLFAAGSICLSYSVPCTTADRALRCRGISSGNVTVYTAILPPADWNITDGSVLANCNTLVTRIQTTGSIAAETPTGTGTTTGTIIALCTSDNCNAPSTPTPSIESVYLAIMLNSVRPPPPPVSASTSSAAWATAAFLCVAVIAAVM